MNNIAKLKKEGVSLSTIERYNVQGKRYRITFLFPP